MNNCELTIILMTCNRPIYVREALNSIINQSINGFKIIISDNSTDKKTYEIVKNEFSNIEYKSHFPGKTAEEHFKLVRKYVCTSHFMLFHDDDILEINYVHEILNVIKKHPEAGAIATNGYFIGVDGEIIQKNKIFNTKEEFLIFYNKPLFLKQYLSYSAGGAAPFSSYVYNKNLIKDIEMDWTQGRAYFDTIFLANIAEKYKIYWINKPLVKIRCHDLRISEQCGVKDYKAFIKIIEHFHKNEIEKIYLNEYRYVQLYYNLKKSKKYPFPALKYLIINFFVLNYMSESFRLRIYYFLLKKFKLIK